MGSDSAADLVRQGREERAAELERAIEGGVEMRHPLAVGAATTALAVSRKEADEILARIDETRRPIMGGRVFADDATETVRRDRERRSEELFPGSRPSAASSP